MYCCKNILFNNFVFCFINRTLNCFYIYKNSYVFLLIKQKFLLCFIICIKIFQYHISQVKAIQFIQFQFVQFVQFVYQIIFQSSNNVIKIINQQNMLTKYAQKTMLFLRRYSHAMIKVACKREKFRLTEDGVARIHGNLVFRRIADQSLGICEGYVTRCCPVALIIGDDLNLPVLENTHARVRGAQVNSNRWCFRHCYFLVLSQSRCNQILKQ